MAYHCTFESVLDIRLNRSTKEVNHQARLAAARFLIVKTHLSSFISWQHHVMLLFCDGSLFVGLGGTKNDYQGFTF